MPDQLGNKQNQYIFAHFTKLGSNLVDSIVKRFSNPLTARRNRCLLFFITALLLTFVILPKRNIFNFEFKPGNIAASDIRAPREFLVEDRVLTEQRRKNAGNSAPIIYNLSNRIPSTISEKLTQALSYIAEKNSSPPQNISIAEHQKTLSTLLGTELTAEETQALIRIKSDKAFLAGVATQLNRLYRLNIVPDGKVFQTNSQRGIEILDNEGHPIGSVAPSTQYTEIADARNIVADWEYSGLGNPKDAHRISSVITRILLPNLLYNREASEIRSATVMESVSPVLFKVQKGEMIVRLGDRISAEQSQKLQKIFQDNRGSNRFFTAIGLLAIILTLFYFPYRFACRNIRKFNPTNKDILTLSLLIVGSFLFFKTALLVTHNIGSAFPRIETNIYYYLFPFAAGAMIIRVIMNSESAFIYCAVTAPLLGIMFDNNAFVAIYAFLGGILGAHGIRQCANRGTIHTAGLKVSFINLTMVLAFQAFSNNFMSTQTLYASLFAIISGIVNSALVSTFIPIIESLFNYTTNIRLLELANLNSPLLKDLMVQAPGTYHHSVVVGNLVEAAAESIHANPLLARVAAYYHDIGKTSKPLYYIENQAGEDNRHDKLSPSMSSLILISHIKEGAEMGRESHLGQPIIDIIRQHHGTALIKFFYDRAKVQAESTGASVEEKDFRYPGPKPQTKEAGIVMLADCVEAASRTLVDPTPDRIQGMVQKLINNIFIDGQLDECELTLKDLHQIAKSFNGILNGIFHHRIDYPDPVHKGGQGKKPPFPSKNKPEGHDKRINGEEHKHADIDQQSSEETSDTHPPAQKSGVKDIKRLGMS